MECLERMHIVFPTKCRLFVATLFLICLDCSEWAIYWQLDGIIVCNYACSVNNKLPFM